MKFTNDIKFSKSPISNETIKITYKGDLFKNNSSELYIVYGFGENWDNTTEQKMEKRSYGFVTYVKMQNYNTFNFCFKNSDFIWDNNNSFNYISNIESKQITNEIETLPEQEANIICSNSIDNIINSINIELDNSRVTTQKIADDSNILDALIQELYKEYTANTQASVIQQETEYIKENSSPSIQENLETNEIENIFNEPQETPEPSNIEYFSELSQLFDEIITNIETPTPQTEDIDVGHKLNEVFENIFSEEFETPQESIEEAYIPEKDDSIEFTNAINNEELNKTFSDIVKNISKVNTETNSKVDTLNYDYSDFNEMFAFAKNLNKEETKISEEEKIFDFSNLDFDFNMNNTTQNSAITENIFDFSNKEFDFNLNTNSVIEENKTENKFTFTNRFSDSFYDDEDVTVHENFTNLQEIVNSFSTELDQVTENATTFTEDSALSEESEKFDVIVNEYAQYFDNLIEEIVSTSSSTLSTPVSTEQVLASENTSLTLTEAESTALASAATNEVSTDGVPDEYALYDYKSHSFLYMIKRRFKQIFSTLFTKLPKIFSKETQNENN